MIHIIANKKLMHNLIHIFIVLHDISGSKKLNDGDLHVLGGKPGSAQSGVPGPKLGYMPQVKPIIFFYDDNFFFK